MDPFADTPGHHDGASDEQPWGNHVSSSHLRLEHSENDENEQQPDNEQETTDKEDLVRNRPRNTALTGKLRNKPIKEESSNITVRDLAPIPRH